MKLIEHEAKHLLKTSGVAIPKGILVKNRGEASLLKGPVVLKSQVPVGGRGKLGGVVVVTASEDIPAAIDTLFALDIKGYRPHVLLAEEQLYIAREHYVALLVDRTTADIRLVAHATGGIEVEGNSKKEFLNIPIDDSTLASCTKQLAAYLGYELSKIEPLLLGLYSAFITNDATLIEVNPLILTTYDDLVCGDCKMELDDAARFRHPEWNFEDTLKDTNFVVLDKQGTIATIANGAGLAMATVDAVAARGMTPANFLDIGGGANTESVLRAFERIITFPRIEAIVINIFAGITRCDEVAKAIIAAKKQIEHLPPLFIRLAGTNFEEAVELLAQENIPTLATLEECLMAAQEQNV